MKPLHKLIMLTMIVLAMLSAKSYGQDTPGAVSSLPKDEPVAAATPTPTPVTFDDAAKLILDRLDAADEYIAKLEQSGAAVEDRLALEKQRTGLLASIKDAQAAEIAALKKQIEAGQKIENEQAKVIDAQDTRIKKLEKKKGGGFLKGLAVGIIVGKFLPFP
jgi:septal ring factor EnvC (AmiA/AmiB activator)